MAENVRLALGLVARGEAPLGIVYETDAKIETAVKVIGVFPDNTDDPIIYPVALTDCQARKGAWIEHAYPRIANKNGFADRWRRADPAPLAISAPRSDMTIAADRRAAGGLKFADWL